ncbi:MAG: hypothetical protein ACXVEE_20550 [Polyangiales bacterium]
MGARIAFAVSLWLALVTIGACGSGGEGTAPPFTTPLGDPSSSPAFSGSPAGGFGGDQTSAAAPSFGPGPAGSSSAGGDGGPTDGGPTDGAPSDGSPEGGSSDASDALVDLGLAD